MPGPGRVHCQGGGAQHVASAGRRGPLVRAEMRGAEHPPRPRRRAWGPRACSRPAPTSSPSLRSVPLRRRPAPQPPEKPLTCARARGRRGRPLGPGRRRRPRARTLGRPLPTPRSHRPAAARPTPPEPEPEPNQFPAGADAALRSAGPRGPQLPQCRARPGGSRRGCGRGQRRRPEGRG